MNNVSLMKANLIRQISVADFRNLFQTAGFFKGVGVLCGVRSAVGYFGIFCQRFLSLSMPIHDTIMTSGSYA